MALNNLKAELVKRGIKQYVIAESLNMTASNLNRKLAESVPFMRDEMYAIRGRYFPELTIDYLFQSDGDKPSKVESLHSQVDLIDEAMRREVGDGDPEVREITSLLHECVNEWGMRHEDGADDRSAA